MPGRTTGGALSTTAGGVPTGQGTITPGWEPGGGGTKTPCGPMGRAYPTCTTRTCTSGTYTVGGGGTKTRVTGLQKPATKTTASPRYS